MEPRKPLWEDLRSIGQHVTTAWLVCGNFNAVLHPQDRMFGSPVTMAEIKDYSECIQDTMLSELAWKREYMDKQTSW